MPWESYIILIPEGENIPGSEDHLSAVQVSLPEVNTRRNRVHHVQRVPQVVDGGLADSHRATGVGPRMKLGHVVEINLRNDRMFRYIFNLSDRLLAGPQAEQVPRLGVGLHLCRLKCYKFLVQATAILLRPATSTVHCSKNNHNTQHQSQNCCFLNKPYDSFVLI